MTNTENTAAAQVYAAYAALAPRSNDWVSLLDLRNALDMTTDEATAAIRSIRHDSGVCIVHDPDLTREGRTPQFRAAGVKIGPEMCDIIAIQS